MAIKTTTGLAAYLMVTGSGKSAFDGGSLKVFSGTPPASADLAETGDLVWEIKRDDGVGGVEGLVFSATANGRAMEKPSADTWGGATVAGTAGYFRLVQDTDDGLEDDDQLRVQGTVGSTGAEDFYMSNTVLTTDTDVLAKTIAAFSVALPTN